MMYESPFQKIDPYDWFCGPGSHVHMLCKCRCVLRRNHNFILSRIILRMSMKSRFFEMFLNGLKLCHHPLTAARLSFADLTPHACVFSRQRDVDPMAILYITECGTELFLVYPRLLRCTPMRNLIPTFPFCSSDPRVSAFPSPFM